MIGLDSNILAYALDPTFPEHHVAKDAILNLDGWYVNPTVIHEVYHTLVFKRKMEPTSANKKLVEFLADRRTSFVNQTKLVTVFSLSLASRFNMGGRDSLIVGCYLHAKVTRILTHDEELLKLKVLRFRGKAVELVDPIRKM